MPRWSMLGNGAYFLGLGVLSLRLELLTRAWVWANAENVCSLWRSWAESWSPGQDRQGSRQVSGVARKGQWEDGAGNQNG